MKDKKFTLTESHLTLLKSMLVGWQDCETGAPEIDPKRPYGNSDVAGDIIELLEWINEGDIDEDDEDAFYEGEVFEELRVKAMILHEQTGTALQIILQTGSFTLGNYENVSEYGNNWKLRA